MDKEGPGVLRDCIDGAGFEGFFPNLVDVLALTEITRIRDDVEVVLLANPWHHDRGVEAAAVRQNDLVACHRRGSIKDKQAHGQPSVGLQMLLTSPGWGNRSRLRGAVIFGRTVVCVNAISSSPA